MKALGFLAGGALAVVLPWADIVPPPSAPSPVTVDDPVTWADDVAPLIYTHCVECHRPGQVAPFSLVDYEDAAKRAPFLAEAVESRYMPPWLPAPNPLPLAGARRLSDDEIGVLRQWAEAEAPPGDLSLAPAPPSLPAEGWKLGEPDLVIEMEEWFTVPAVNRDVYRAFVLPFDARDLAEEIRAAATIPDSDWLAVKAVEVRPSDARVVHHALVFLDDSGAARLLDAADPGPGYEAFGEPGFPPSAFLGGYVPGSQPYRLPEGIAEKMPARGDVVLMVHYSPLGKPTKDRLRVGLHFAREPIARLNTWVRLGTFALDIPPGEARYDVIDSLTLPTDVFVTAISPHMHYLGRETAAIAQLPEGGVVPLIHIPQWNFNWQDKYFYVEPVFLPAGSTIMAQWTYDNSSANLSNPHVPPRRVTFGPESRDEMCELHLDVVPVDLEGYALLDEMMRNKMLSLFDAMPAPLRQRFDLQEAYENLGLNPVEARRRAVEVPDVGN